MKEVDGGGKQRHEVPLCDACEGARATKHCRECATAIQFSCDSCFTFLHKTAKKKGHTSTPIWKRLASPPVHAALGGPALPWCRVHGKPLDVYCNTCDILICAMCGILQHNGHDFTPIEKAVGKHRNAIEALLAGLVVSRQEAIAATNAIKIIRGELDGNRDAAIKLIDEEFNKLLRAIRERRDALKKMVSDAYTEKDDVLNTQITALESIESHSERALQLVEAKQLHRLNCWSGKEYLWTD